MMKYLMKVGLFAVLLVLGTAWVASAGNLDSPGDPTAGSNMPTTTEIYNQLDNGTNSTPTASFTEPTTGPGSSGRSLSEIKAKLPVVDNTNGAAAGDVLPGKTFWGLSSGSWATRTGSMTNVGQQNVTPTISNQTITSGYHNGTGVVSGDADLLSGNIRNGVTIFGITGDSNVVNTSSGDATSANIGCGKKAWVDGVELTGTGVLNYSARWNDNCDGTITDKTTNLTWMQDSSGLGTRDWSSAVAVCTDSVQDGTYGLSDGSAVGAWRLPNKAELAALANGSEALRYGSPGPFLNVIQAYYWSFTSVVSDQDSAWLVYFYSGYVDSYSKAFSSYARCVR